MQRSDMSTSVIAEEEEQADLISDSWELVGCTTQSLLQPPPQSQTQPQTQSQSLLGGYTLEGQQSTSVGCTTRPSEGSVNSDRDRGCTLIEGQQSTSVGCTTRPSEGSGDSDSDRGCTLTDSVQNEVRGRESVSNEEEKVVCPVSELSNIKVKE